MSLRFEINADIGFCASENPTDAQIVKNKYRHL